ncbi:mycothiol transferase [Arthrobacter sp. SLBN-83]|uniref:mycothiol transferase n=1 Tax=Arthrobacter sp. SLBN-83 TaxID=2768449 RepID=UPI00114E5C43
MPVHKSDRGAQLREYLNDAREAILWKCEGLSDAQARTPLTQTGTHVMGLLLHLAVTESQYLISCVGRKLRTPLSGALSHPRTLRQISSRRRI